MTGPVTSRRGGGVEGGGGAACDGAACDGAATVAFGSGGGDTWVAAYGISTTSVVWPTRIRSPSRAIVGPSMRRPFRYVPFVDPRSMSSIPPDTGRNSTWLPETWPSVRTMSFVPRRPRVMWRSISWVAPDSRTSRNPVTPSADCAAS
jgi:hypothetical protein